MSIKCATSAAFRGLLLVAAGLAGGFAAGDSWQVEVRREGPAAVGAATSFLRPLDEIQVVVTATAGPGEARVVVSDGHGQPYHTATIVPSGGAATTKTLVRGAQGQHAVRVLVGDRCVRKVAFDVAAQTRISTGLADLDAFLPTMRAIVQNNMTSMCIDGRVLKGCAAGDVVWLRDHTHMMKGFRYWERDLVELVDHFLKYQMPDGSYFDYTKQFKDPKRLARDALTYGLMQNLATVDQQRMLLFRRIGVEADLEYLAVEAVHDVWQATGDDAWMRSALAKLEKGLDYAMSSPYRWSPEHQLVKRPFTIDSWDFEYGQPTTLPDGRKIRSRTEIDRQTRFCIMHGDNSGMYHACTLLAKMFREAGRPEKAARWQQAADQFRRQMHKICWNGRFYTHQVHIHPVKVEGVDEARQLSLSNPLAINRGVCDHAQAVSILAEYRARQATTRAFAEWFSLDPPFPDGAFGFKLEPGRYVNGGILPMVGGELAQAAFEHGMEDYGVDILRRYYRMLAETHETCFAYHASGYKDPRVEFPGNGWGAAVMTYALVAGLGGIADEASLYRTVRVSPRWPAAGVQQADCCARYAASDAYCAYRYRHDQTRKQIRLQLAGSGQRASFHLLLPPGGHTQSVVAGGKSILFRDSLVENSRYADFSASTGDGEFLVCYTKH